MMKADDIRHLIERGLPEARVQVSGDDGQHFEAVVVSPAFAGQSRVRQHQMVYAALGDQMRSAIHALSLQTLTPEESASQAQARGNV